MNILLTGITGFIGKHLACELLENGHKIIALVREKSAQKVFDFFEKNDKKDLFHNIIFLNLKNFENNKNTFLGKIKEFSPNVFIHLAWIGVEAKERNDWQKQLENLHFLMKIFEIIEKNNLKKIIAFGSQAEIGLPNEVVDENIVCNPITAYGSVKLAFLQLLKDFCKNKNPNLEWYWLRIFSVFGEEDNPKNFIPYLLENFAKNQDVDLTACEQCYDFSYVKDITNAILKVVENTKDNSGIYNLGNNKSIMLKDAVHIIQKITNSTSKINFGKIPYSPYQIMLMQGNSNKFYKIFDFLPKYTFENAIKKMTENYL